MMRQLGCLAVCLALATAAAADTLDNFFDGLKTLHGQFDQQLIDDAGKVSNQGAGEMWIGRPGRFRWEYRRPYQQLIISDGRQIWIYEPDLQQATVRALDQALTETPAWLLSGERPLRESFTVTLRADISDQLQHYRLTPLRKEGGYASFELVFSTAGVLQWLDLTDVSAQVTRLKFSGLQRNAAVASAIFGFTPPAGVDVMGEVRR